MHGDCLACDKNASSCSFSACFGLSVEEEYYPKRLYLKSALTLQHGGHLEV